MVLNLRCADYGFECSFALNAKATAETIQKLRHHFEEEHGIDYTTEAVIQMVTNRGHTLDSIRR